MDDRGIMEWIGFLITYCLGIRVGMLISQMQAADAALSSTPPKWWSIALIDAKARKEKEKLN